MKHFLLLVLAGAMLCTASCATSKRLSRVNSEHVLQRHNDVDGNAVNLWPFFIASKDYKSVFYPFIDWDDRGFSVRPIVNKEGDEWAFLFPLFATNPQNGDGWCGIAYWNKPGNYFGMFPLFHYSADKADLKYILPIWWYSQRTWNNDAQRYEFTGTNFGFFPLLWSYDRSGMFFPLCFFDERDFYSWIFTMKIRDNEKYYGKEYNWSKMPDDSEMIRRRVGENLWYYALLWYAGHDHYKVLPLDHTEALPFYDYSIYNNFYLSQTGKNKVNRNDIQRFYFDRFDKVATEQQERWFGLVPFFHYSSFMDSYKFNILFGLGTSIRRTPQEDHTSILLVLYNRTHERNRGKFAVDHSDSTRRMIGLLWMDEQKMYQKMNEKAAFRLNGLDARDLIIRTYLVDPKDIKDWEKSFADRQKNLLQNNKQGSYTHFSGTRPIYRTGVIPTPKTAAEAEALLKDLKDPKHYLPVTERTRRLFPFYSFQSKQEGKALTTDSRLLLGLLYRDQNAPYENFFHIFGPFGYLHSHKSGEGDYEREKWHSDFRMSLLYYQSAYDRYERTKKAEAQYGGILEDELRRRLILTDPKAIRVWEREMESRIRSLTGFSTVKVPKSAAEAQALLDEMNRLEHYQLKQRRTRGFAPFFHRMTDHNESQTDLLLGLLASFRSSPTRELTHVLGPFGYFHQIERSAEDAKYGDQFQNNVTCIFLMFNGNEQKRYRTAASQKALKDRHTAELIRRLRLTDPKEIAEWERNYTITAWWDNPANPVPTPKSAAEAKQILDQLDTPQNFADEKSSGWGMLPFLDVQTGTHRQATSVLGGLLFDRDQSRYESGTRDHFSILGKLGYSATDTTSPDHFGKTATSRSRYALLTGQRVRNEWRESQETLKLQGKALGTNALLERLRMTDPGQIRKWETKTLVWLWEQDPTAETLPAIPKTEAEVRAMLLKCKEQEQIVPFVTTEKTVLGPLVFTSKEERWNGEPRRYEWDLGGGLLSGYKKNSYREQFHFLGPFGFLTETKTRGGEHFKDSARKESFNWFALLCHTSRDEYYTRTAASKRIFRDLNAYDVRYQIDPEGGKKHKDEQIKEWKRQHTRLDGTLSYPIPETADGARKFWRDYHADQNYQAEAEYGFGITPLVYYSNTESGEKAHLILPPLLSWYWKNHSGSSTKILFGLLYSGSTEKYGTAPEDMVFLDQLPNIVYDQGAETGFLNGDREFSGYEDESRRILLVAAKHSGKAYYWKAGTPKKVINLYNELGSSYLFYERGKHQKTRARILADLKRMNLPAIDLFNWESRQLVRKQLFDQYVATGEFYERGNFGKLLYRYASSRERTAFWLGGGLLAKYEKQSNGEENTSVLGWLYRSRITPTEQTKLYFPFIKTHEDQQKESFSFLWRVINVETDKKTGEKSGHIFFIPF